jgi:hypothetical protein
MRRGANSGQLAWPQDAKGQELPEIVHRELVRRILESPIFSRSERLSALLGYVCEVTFRGRGDELSEQSIGHAVFGRSKDYDSAVDGIVRTQASRLRQRLDLYFQQEGVEEPVRLVIPRGGYVPVFERRPVIAPPESIPTVLDLPPVLPPLRALEGTRSQRMRWLPWVFCALLLVAVVQLTIWNRRLAAVTPTVSTHPLWSHLLVKGRPTLVIPADSGLVLFHNISGRSMGLNEYLAAKYRAQPPQMMGYKTGASMSDWISNLADRRYTSIVDLNAVSSLERLAQTQHSEIQVRYARDVRPNDLKSGNDILLGASEANPWVELYEHNMNFILHNDYKANVFSVINRSPKAGEPAQWDSSIHDPQRRVYCIVAFVPNLAGDGNTLIVEGTSMSGTEGAWDFISDDTQLSPFLKQIQRKDGSVPHFELLLGNHNMSASAIQGQVLAWRVID